MRVTIGTPIRPGPEANVAVGDARDGGDGFGVGEVLGAVRCCETTALKRRQRDGTCWSSWRG